MLLPLKGERDPTLEYPWTCFIVMACGEPGVGKDVEPDLATFADLQAISNAITATLGFKTLIIDDELECKRIKFHLLQKLSAENERAKRVKKATKKKGKKK